MQKVLIVGGAGYIGSMLSPALIERGHEVTVLDLLWFGNNLPSDIEVLEGDFFNLLEPELSHYDCVVFLAGLSNDPMANWSPKDNFIANTAGAAFLAYMSKQATVSRFIHGGSCSVYGAKPGMISYEDSVTRSDFPYGLSKLSGESACLQLVSDKFSVISLRKGTVSGRSPRMRFDLIVNTMVRDAVMKGVITVNNSDIWRPILCMKDAVMAYVAAIEAPKELSGIFNVASMNYRVGEVAEFVQHIIADTFGKAVKIDTHHKADSRNYRVSWQKAMEFLDWMPRQSISGLVMEIVSNWDSYGDVMQSKYYNIEIFKTLEAPNIQTQSSIRMPEIALHRLAEASQKLLMEDL